MTDLATTPHHRSDLTEPLPRLTDATSTPTAESRLVQVRPDLRLHVVAQGPDDAPAVVLLHGIGDSWQSYRLALPHLTRDLRVFAVTLRGHGESDRPAAGYRLADYAADVLTLLDVLDLDRVTLVGHSLGSFVAQAVAVRAASRLDRLVLVGSSPGGVFNPVVRELVSAMFRAVTDPVDPAFAREFQSSTVGAAVPAGFFETMVAEAQRLPARAWREFAAQPYDESIVAGLRSVHAPALLLWGDADTIFDHADQAALLERLPASGLLEYPGTGHALHWEQPERFARDLVAFVRQVR